MQMYAASKELQETSLHLSILISCTISSTDDVLVGASGYVLVALLKNPPDNFNINDCRYISLPPLSQDLLWPEGL